MFWIRADHLLDTTSNSDIIVVVTPSVNRLEGGEKGSARNVPQPSKMRWKQRRSTMQVMWNQKSSGKGEGNASHCVFSIDIQCIKQCCEWTNTTWRINPAESRILVMVSFNSERLVWDYQLYFSVWCGPWLTLQQVTVNIVCERNLQARQNVSGRQSIQFRNSLCCPWKSPVQMIVATQTVP